MSSRRVRTVFATPFVLTVACGKPDDSIRTLEVTREHTACVVREAKRPAYAYDCSERQYQMRTTAIVSPQDPNTELLAMTADGTCHARPSGCGTRACLVSERPCPPPRERATPPLTSTWKVTRTGERCTIQSAPASSVSPRVASIENDCPDYPEDTARITRRDGRCEADNGYDCEPGATCNPPAPTYVPCPTR